ncbi:MAG: serine/threonine-protein kinase [Nitrospinota bacterium]
MAENADVLKNVGRYRIEKKIGQGAMGVVYLALDDMIDRRVAIKSLRMDRLKTEDERKNARELFFHEAKVIGKLNHSHITAIYDMGVHDGSPYIVMEFVDGLNIKETVDENVKFTLKQKLNLISMVARAIHYAHQRGILHRDIKPANIMILANLAPKITDFGIARIMDAAASGAAKAPDEEGVIMGTPHYMSPEQIRGGELDRRSDIFSLGTLMYEWISGQKPFASKGLKELLRSILNNDPKPISKICDVDGNVEIILKRALAKDPKDRFQSAEEFSDILELYINKMEMEDSRPISRQFSYDKLQIVRQLKKDYVFFSDFTEEELFSIFKLSGKEVFKKDEHIIKEGTSGTKMYIIISGKVLIYKNVEGKKMNLKKMGVGNCIGEMSIIDRMPRSASVIALEHTALIAINETVLRLSNPKLALKLYRNLAAMISEKLRVTDAKYLDLLAGRG